MKQQICACDNNDRLGGGGGRGGYDGHNKVIYKENKEVSLSPRLD